MVMMCIALNIHDLFSLFYMYTAVSCLANFFLPMWGILLLNRVFCGGVAHL